MVQLAIFQLPFCTDLTGLVSDKNLEELQLHHVTQEPEYLAWASRDYIDYRLLRPQSALIFQVG